MLNGANLVTKDEINFQDFTLESKINLRFLVSLVRVKSLLKLIEAKKVNGKSLRRKKKHKKIFNLL